MAKKKKNIIRIRKSGWWMLQTFFRMSPLRAIAYIFLDSMRINMREETVEILTYFSKGQIRSPEDSSLEEVTDVEVKQGPLALLLRYGSVTVRTSGEDMEEFVVRNPMKVKNWIMKAKADAEVLADVDVEARHKLAVEKRMNELRGGG